MIKLLRGIFNFLKEKKVNHLFHWVDDALLDEIKMLEVKYKELVDDLNDVRKMMLDNVELQKNMVKKIEEEMNSRISETIKMELSVAKMDIVGSLKMVGVIVSVVVSVAWLYGKLI